MDLNAEILRLKSDLRTQKNLAKNLLKINQSVQQENKDRAKDNIHLRSSVTNLEKQIAELSQHNGGLTTNVMRHKKVTNQLQGRLVESQSNHTQQLKEKDSIIQRLSEQLTQLMEEKRSETETRENEILLLRNERDRLNVSVQLLTGRWEGVERENNYLNEELGKAREHCTDAARFLNRELEKAFESMHTKLERDIAKKDEYRMKIFENENERDQILAFMLSEGLQMPLMAPLNISQAREKIRVENLSFDETY
jgi:DNA repair exonuclease SbcCD ATPase subunit